MEWQARALRAAHLGLTLVGDEGSVNLQLRPTLLALSVPIEGAVRLWRARGELQLGAGRGQGGGWRGPKRAYFLASASGTMNAAVQRSARIVNVAIEERRVQPTAIVGEAEAGRVLSQPVPANCDEGLDFGIKRWPAGARPALA